MAYAPIAKLDKFNGKEDDAQVWLNNVVKAITANNWNDARAMQVISYFLQNTTDVWYQSLAVKLQNFNGFKTEFLWYFSNNNSINKLANTFTTIRQGDTKAITTYLGCFHRNLHQIQAIQADYFTAPQILNQFIRELHSSILQQVHSMHPVDLPTTVTYARDFEAAELEANHTQAVNVTMNRSSELDSKLKQFMTSKDTTSSNQGIKQQQPLINNIPPATITENEFLDAIFPFELKEPSDMPLFSRAALEEKLIMAMYTDAKVNGHSIKLILDSGSAGSIIIQQLMNQLDRQVDCTASARIITADGATKTPIGKINDFPIEVNGIIKAYQVSWADEEHNELPPILSWDNNGKEKQKRTEPT
ncbi:hypothetical protein G9A89_012802 [Geosiphon pyriformis]|nr:hypothetical protein G9A89_012802 [Geosiphon pyriformis]